MRLRSAVCLVLAVAFSTCFGGEDIFVRPLDELVNIGLDKPPANVEVSTAAKYGQSQSDAPAAVHVITRQDIRTYGYRTLGEALRSLPGLNISSDRQDVFLDGRGYSLPGSFNTRFLILLDGERVNDSVFDSSLVGGEFPIDVDLIERIEYAPGPGSAIYGRNAMLGVINVITRRGHTVNGGELSLEYGGFDTYKARGTYGKRYENGSELLLSATGFDRGGPDRPPIDSSHSWDTEHRESAFGKFSHGPFSLEVGHVSRLKGVNDAAHDRQTHTFVISSFEDRIAKDLNLYLRSGFHDAAYTGVYPYLDDNNRLQRWWETGRGQWWDAESRFSFTGWERHRVLFGAEIQHNFRSVLKAEDGAVPIATDLSAGNPFAYGNFLVAGYIQDEYRILDSLSLLAGVRYDRNPFGSRTNPRAGLIWQARKDTTLKLLWGTAYRPPNLFEVAGLPATLPVAGVERRTGIGPETIDSLELTLEHLLAPQTRLTTSLYHYDLHNVVVRHANEGLVRGHGAEISGEHRFATGARATLSYTFQDALTRGDERPANTPAHMVKLHLSTPLFSDHWHLGLESLYTSDRRRFNADAGYGRVSGALLTNVTVTTEVNEWLDFSAGVYNVFDYRYSDPIRQSFGIDAMPQDGVSFRLKVNLRY